MKKRPVSDSESSYYESESDENESNFYYSDTEMAEHLVKICNKIIKNPYKKVNSGIQIKRDKILEEIQSINIDETDIKNQILDSQLPLYNKAQLIQDLENQTSDKFKLRTYIKRVLKLPHNQITQREMNKEIFLTRLRKNLDECIYGHKQTKEEIMDYVIARINNPNGKSTSILALHSQAGLGKTRFIRALGKSLNLPFNQISLGGMSDASILSGHDYTYIGSKPGKIYEAIVKSNCTNGILYFDELCKIPEDKNTAINGVLTYILDPEQNSEFYDNYIGNVPIDLSKMFFILSFNDITKVDPIILNRLKVIKIKEPKLSEKVEIVKLFSIPELTKNINLPVKLSISDQLIKYIINVKTKKEQGMRNINRNIGTIIAKVNFLSTVSEFTEHSKSVLTKDFTYEKMTSFKIIDNTFTVTKEFIDISLGETEGPETHSYSQMYI